MYETEVEIIKKIWIKQIVKTRKEKGYTQEKFAELLDLSREHIAKIETGKRNLSLEKFISALIILGIIRIKKKKLIVYNHIIIILVYINI